MGGEVFAINVINDGNGWLNFFTMWWGVLKHRKQNQLMISLNGNYGNIKGSYIPILYPNRRLKVYVQNSKIQYIIQTSLW
jgi:hypothetical protein